MDLVQLQNLCKRDPESYKEEFDLQHRHFQTELQIFKLKPSKDSDSFSSLVTFLAHMSTCYRKELADFPQQVMELIEQNYTLLESDLRITLVKALMLMRNKNFIPPESLLRLFFKLFRCPDKALRKMLYSHIVQDIRNINSKHKNNKLNRTLQNFMYTMLEDTNETAAKNSLNVMIDLYRKHVWNDAKTVNIVSMACFSRFTKIKVAGYKFFLSTQEEESEDSEQQKPGMTAVEAYAKYSTRGVKTRKRKRRMERAMKKAKKAHEPSKKDTPNFPAMELLNDPQGFTKKLFKSLKSSNDRFEVKLMCANLISRLISYHKLLVLNFYSFMQKYIQPHQQHLTVVLAIIAQACHDLVPPETLEPLVKKLSDDFVDEHQADQVVAIGLNTIREICARQPLAMNADLLQSLTRLKKSRDKGTMMACRSLIGLFRKVNPHLLHKSDRGKFVDMSIQPAEYGEFRPAQGVDGVELLENADRAEGGQGASGVDGEAEGEMEGYDSEGEMASDQEHGKDYDEDDESAALISTERDFMPLSVKDDDHIEETASMQRIALGKAKRDEAEEEEEDEEEEAEGEGETHSAEGGASQQQENPQAQQTCQPLVGTKRPRIDAVKILNSKELERIKRRKQEIIEETDPEATGADASGILDPSELMGYYKPRATKEERLERVKEGREGRPKYGYRPPTQGSSTNKAKLKNHPFMMVRQSAAVRQKRKQPMHQKQKKKGKKRRGRK